jgi:glycosidase
MNWFALWLMWLSKMLSFMEGVLKQESAPEPQEPAPKRREGAPKQQDMAREQQEIAPNRPETPPQPQESAPPARQEIVPKQPETPPQPQESAPWARQEIVPKQPETPPQPQESVPPARQEIVPNQPETSPQSEIHPLREASGKAKTGESSMTWRKRPVIYEIPVWVWLDELRARYGQSLTLGTVPASEWDALAELAVDAVWLMGVWERSPAGVAVANANPEQQAEFRYVLPDYEQSDNVGSAYCVRDYVVAKHLGGPEALAQARAALNARGLRLVLDFVPNHVAIDHPWAFHYPEYFVHGSYDDLVRAPHDFVEVAGHVLANGRDPYFPPWRDVLQVNAFHPGLRAAAIETVSAIAAQCDGMRCDMAMLLLNEIFERTWGARAGARPATEYWQEIIPAVKAAHPDVLFIAEAYWDLEWELMQKGFDYCYDKRLYDRLVHDNADSVRAHLGAGLDYQDRLVRFIENHDEPRAAAIFSGPKEQAAAVVIATTPGAKLVYDGEIEGRKVRLPVFLARRPSEATDEALAVFHRALLKAVHADLFHDGEWHLCERYGWPDNQSVHNIVAWTWRRGEERTLVVVNLADHRSQGMILLPWDDLRGRTWRLVETLNWECYVRGGDELGTAGLFVDLDAWGHHFLKFE